MEGTAAVPWDYGLLKLAATVLSTVSGLPGGIFSPSLAVGAGLGANVGALLPGVPVDVAVLLGMTGYFAGVLQAPITAFVIMLEMTNDHAMALPLMAVALLAYGVSRLVCPPPGLPRPRRGLHPPTPPVLTRPAAFCRTPPPSRPRAVSGGRPERAWWPRRRALPRAFAALGRGGGAA